MRNVIYKTVLKARAKRCSTGPDPQLHCAITGLPAAIGTEAGDQFRVSMAPQRVMQVVKLRLTVRSRSPKPAPICRIPSCFSFHPQGEHGCIDSVHLTLLQDWDAEKSWRKVFRAPREFLATNGRPRAWIAGVS